MEKFLKVVGNILFIIFMLIMGFLILITAQSRLTGKEPSLLGHRLYIVNSGSMSPTIKVDSMIIVKEKAPEEIVEGDIITYYGHNRESRVTHRVVEVENNGEFFITKGDANNTNDPMPLEGQKLIGKVALTIPLIGRIFRLLTTKVGLALFITIAIVWMIFPKVLQEIKKGRKFSHGGDR